MKLSINDDGCGMEETTKARIFDPFFTTKKTGEGTGLGLSVVHGIIKKHKGDIAVESSPGKGTTFSIFLPIADESVLIFPKRLDFEQVSADSEMLILGQAPSFLIDLVDIATYRHHHG